VGKGETIRTGEWHETGPYAFAIMSAVCELWLPALKHLTLKGTISGLDGLIE
jgi:hypothetical protein